MDTCQFDVAIELERFHPLILSTARRYVGRGAEFEDLVQEGNLALIRLALQCTDPDEFPAFLKKRLPGLVRTAARREWRKQAESLDDFLEKSQEPRTEPAFRVADPRIERALLPEEAILVQMLVDGYSQAEIAGSFGITQQAVSARVRKIRQKLGFLKEGENSS